jgi:protein-L-isoaspartate(D-aspartate) O-methyltransferase
MKNPQINGIGMTSQRTRDRLVRRLKSKGITNQHVLDVIRHTPRHLFVDEALSSRAYEDTALPIGHCQTISQPYIVARMTEVLLSQGELEKVLEVGTGSGYQTALLAKLVPLVYSIERIPAFSRQARKRIHTLGITNVHFKCSDGSWGWPSHAPYDAIIVTAAPEQIPKPLLEQLAPGARMLIPVGRERDTQKLSLVKRTSSGFKQEVLESVSFVPLVLDQTAR